MKKNSFDKSYEENSFSRDDTVRTDQTCRVLMGMISDDNIEIAEQYTRSIQTNTQITLVDITKQIQEIENFYIG